MGAAAKAGRRGSDLPDQEPKAQKAQGQEVARPLGPGLIHSTVDLV
jgi:hypothetical protein